MLFAPPFRHNRMAHPMAVHCGGEGVVRTPPGKRISGSTWLISSGAMASNISSAVQLVFDSISALLRLPPALRKFCQAIDRYTRPAYLALKRKAIHFLKAMGILITIAFAGASLYYAKAAADDARCQLELQKRQYCEAASDDIKQIYPCDYILAKDIAPSIEYCCGGLHTRYSELIFTIPWPYFQTYVRDCCHNSLLTGKPWWRHWGRTYTTVYFRPILWRFPDAYWIAESLNGPLGVASAIAGSFVVILAYTRNRRDGFAALGFYLMLVVIPMLFSSLLLSAELGWQNDYLHKMLCRRGRIQRELEGPCSLPSGYLPKSFVGKFLMWGLNGLQSRSFLGVLDSVTGTYGILSFGTE